MFVGLIRWTKHYFLAYFAILTNLWVRQILQVLREFRYSRFLDFVRLLIYVKNECVTNDNNIGMSAPDPENNP